MERSSEEMFGEQIVVQPDDVNLQPFSSLLKMPFAEHRVSKICDAAKVCLNPKAHKLKMPFNELYGPGLKKLGLYHVSRVGDIQIDKALITALVERWRPETCTFHFSYGRDDHHSTRCLLSIRFTY